MKYIGVIGIIAYLLLAQDRYTIFRAAVDTKKVNESSLSVNVISPEPIEVIFGPSPDSLRTIIEYISGAKKRIYLSVYMLTNESVVDALISAHIRGVDTRVLLEPSVYNLPNVNKKAANVLKTGGVEIAFSSERDINFNHSKYFIIDDRAMIATGNMTKSSLLLNREVFAWYGDPAVVNSLVTLFLSDFQHIPYNTASPVIILAPLDARTRLENFINEAKTDLFLMSESFSDENLTKLFISAGERGVHIAICIPKNRTVDTYLQSRLKSAGVVFYKAHGPHIHAKTLLRDGKDLFFGSANFTTNSLDNNREVSAIITKPEVISRYKKIIETDCKS